MKTNAADSTDPGTSVRPDAEPTLGAPGSPLSRRPALPHSPAAFVWVGFATHVVIRVLLSIGRYGPNVVADEIGYLVNARLIAGGTAADMHEATVYRGGYSLLISPAYLISSDPATTYRIVLTINILLSAAVFPLLYHLLTRAFRVPAYPALAVSFLAALYPPLVLNSLLAWSEVALAAVLLLTLVALANLVGAPGPRASWGWAGLVGLLTGLLYTTHGRTAPLVALLVVALILVGAVRADLRAQAALGLVCAAVAIYAGQLLNDYLVTHNWGEAPGGDVSNILDRFADPDAPTSLGVVGMGQYWYFTVGTFGLFALGVAQLVRYARTAGPPGGGGVAGWVRGWLGPDRHGGPLTAAFLVLGLLGLMILTGIVMVAGNRPDHVVYGRYAEIAIPVVLALGLYRAWLLPIRRLAVELAGAFALALVAYLVFRGYKQDLVLRQPVNSYNVLTIPALSNGPTLSTGPLMLRPGRVTLVGLAGAALLALLRWRRWSAVASLGLAAVFLTSSIATASAVLDRTNDLRYGADHSDMIDVPALRETPQDVGYDLAYYDVQGRFGDQWEIPKSHYVLFDSRVSDPPPVRYVISSAHWPAARRFDARIVWRDSLRDQVVWLIPGNPPAGPSETAHS